MRKVVKKKYKFVVIATDVVIFTLKEGQLQVLLIKMKKAPYEKYWALPGGMIKAKESINEAAKKHLFNKTGVKNVYLEQLYTFGRADRDPFGRVVSVAYFALMPFNGLKLKTTREYSEVNWFPVERLPLLAYDHREMITLAKKRLQAKLSYTNIVYSLLSKEFTLSDLQKVYEMILGKKLDKRNFCKKIFALKLLKKTGAERRGKAFRPAKLYEFVRRQLEVIQIL